MRTIQEGQHRFTKIVVSDKPGAGGACHKYYISPVDRAHRDAFGEFAHIKFQNGPVAENGVNGCHQEDLLHIVVDRLEHFQKGDYACRENALALTKIQEALHWLNHRTSDRQRRGVEGTDNK